MPDTPKPSLSSQVANLLDMKFRSLLGNLVDAEGKLELCLLDIQACGLAPKDAEGTPPDWLVPYLVSDPDEATTERPLGTIRGTRFTWVKFVTALSILQGIADELGLNGKAELFALREAALQ